MLQFRLDHPQGSRAEGLVSTAAVLRGNWIMKVLTSTVDGPMGGFIAGGHRELVEHRGNRSPEARTAPSSLFSITSLHHNVLSNHGPRNKWPWPETFWHCGPEKKISLLLGCFSKDSAQWQKANRMHMMYHLNTYQSMDTCAVSIFAYVNIINQWTFVLLLLFCLCE